MLKQQALLGLLLLFAINLLAQPKLEFDREAITTILQQYTAEDSPGIAVGIVKDGKVVYEYYAGYANLEHQVPVSENTRFNIASTAKQFTALMVLQLALEGKLSLEDDIRKYVPSLYTDEAEEIKLRHLINHTSCIRDYTFLYEIKEQAFWQQVGTDNGDIIELLEQQEELVFKPGTKYTYSNSGYTILTKVIEAVSGERFNDYSERFFAELNMNETAFVRRYMGLIPNRADAYSDWGGGRWLADLAVTKSNGDGFLYTTLKDQLTFEVAVQRAAQNKNALLIESQQPIPNSEITDYGFGLELDERLGRSAQHHAGSTFGFHSQTIRFPEEKLSVFVMSNNGKIWSGNIADQVASAILPSIEEKVAYSSLMESSSFDVDQPQIIGQYLSPRGSLIRIVEQDDQLFWRFANWNPLEIIQEGENRFSMAYNADIKVRFNEDSFVQFYPSGKTINYSRNNYVPASSSELEGFVGKYHSRELEMDFELRLTEENQLIILFSNQDEELAVEALSRNDLLAENYSLKVERDQLDNVTDILVTLSPRARNNRFRKGE